MLNTAIKLAVTEHDGQYDKGGMPYILHPLKVMHYLKTDDTELMCIALLHDVVEDTFVTVDTLYIEGMSQRVIDGVIALTKTKDLSPKDYLDRVSKNIDAVRVKLAEQISGIIVIFDG